MKLHLPAERDTLDLGRRLADALAARPGRWLVYLSGDLGAGKTTLVRGLLAGLGHAGRVRSPTFTLMEPYETPARGVAHLDLYRLADPGELEYLGFRDLLAGEGLIVVEWPEHGGDRLPPPDLRIALAWSGAGRNARLQPASARGEALLAGLATLRPAPQPS